MMLDGIAMFGKEASTACQQEQGLRSAAIAKKFAALDTAAVTVEVPREHEPLQRAEEDLLVAQMQTLLDEQRRVSQKLNTLGSLFDEHKCQCERSQRDLTQALGCLQVQLGVVNPAMLEHVAPFYCLGKGVVAKEGDSSDVSSSSEDSAEDAIDVHKKVDCGSCTTTFVGKCCQGAEESTVPVIRARLVQIRKSLQERRTPPRSLREDSLVSTESTDLSRCKQQAESSSVQQSLGSRTVPDELKLIMGDDIEAFSPPVSAKHSGNDRLPDPSFADLGSPPSHPSSSSRVSTPPVAQPSQLGDDLPSPLDGCGSKQELREECNVPPADSATSTAGREQVDDDWHVPGLDDEDDEEVASTAGSVGSEAVSTAKAGEVNSGQTVVEKCPLTEATMLLKRAQEELRQVVTHECLRAASELQGALHDVGMEFLEVACAGHKAKVEAQAEAWRKEWLMELQQDLDLFKDRAEIAKAQALPDVSEPCPEQLCHGPETEPESARFSLLAAEVGELRAAVKVNADARRGDVARLERLEARLAQISESSGSRRPIARAALQAPEVTAGHLRVRSASRVRNIFCLRMPRASSPPL